MQALYILIHRVINPCTAQAWSQDPIYKVIRHHPCRTSPSDPSTTRQGRPAHLSVDLFVQAPKSQFSNARYRNIYKIMVSKTSMFERNQSRHHISRATSLINSASKIVGLTIPAAGWIWSCWHLPQVQPRGQEVDCQEMERQEVSARSALRPQRIASGHPGP